MNQHVSCGLGLNCRLGQRPALWELGKRGEPRECVSDSKSGRVFARHGRWTMVAAQRGGMGVVPHLHNGCETCR